MPTVYSVTLTMVLIQKQFEAVSDLRLQKANTLLVTKLASNNRTSWYTYKVYRTLSILIYNAYNIDETIVTTCHVTIHIGSTSAVITHYLYKCCTCVIAKPRPGLKIITGF